MVLNTTQSINTIKQNTRQILFSDNSLETSDVCLNVFELLLEIMVMFEIGMILNKSSISDSVSFNLPFHLLCSLCEPGQQTPIVYHGKGSESFSTSCHFSNPSSLP